MNSTDIPFSLGNDGSEKSGGREPHTPALPGLSPEIDICEALARGQKERKDTSVLSEEVPWWKRNLWLLSRRLFPICRVGWPSILVIGGITCVVPLMSVTDRRRSCYGIDAVSFTVLSVC